LSTRPLQLESLLEEIMAERRERVELKGSTRAAMPGGRDVGPSDPNQIIEVTVYLRRGSARQEFPDLRAMGAQLPRDRKYLTREEFARVHGAGKIDVEKIHAFATEFGLKVVGENRAARAVKISGTVRALSEAFGADLRKYVKEDGSGNGHGSGSYRCRTGRLTIPADLVEVVEGVFGLDNRPQAKTHFRIRKARPGLHAQAVAEAFSPLDVAQAYAFPAEATGTGQTIGIVELGGGYKTADLDLFFGNLGMATPRVSPVSVDGGGNSPTGDSGGPDGEVELDIEVAGAIAPGAEIGVYFAPNTDQGFIDAVTTAVHDAQLKPSIVSISWGGPEDTWTEQSRNQLNSACQDAATMGVTVVAASGDNGSSDGDPGGGPTVDFPAASPFVIGCGGTKLEISGKAISSEVVWDEQAANEGATGGGVSKLFALPNYQQNAKVPGAPNGFVGRGVPDVAGNADPQTGYNVVVDGQASVIGGTSAVAPLWAGLLARLNQALGANVGFLHPLLYGVKAAESFHDITSGSNGNYSAGPGWDACTGLGTPNGTVLLLALGGKS
jgi:kumamolisin